MSQNAGWQQGPMLQQNEQIQNRQQGHNGPGGLNQRPDQVGGSTQLNAGGMGFSNGGMSGSGTGNGQLPAGAMGGNEQQGPNGSEDTHMQSLHQQYRSILSQQQALLMQFQQLEGYKQQLL
eukprot:CAMPEP_0202879438 /NCGR_PEP_ID=MMETSP1391-20130828/33606_1 /ASSEMBLY_ACC=CAM_ASM_000867 /TAXON_ID=1034604 /ORGANISM="Chlamydomonas leiostraca, Strain SAG 11-49" /LENGTH=120 /DNA_ID=CAMNT_0049561785 /DNA_START=78 /DNA_END=436 /DNA_ORIENTATION=-